MDLNADLFTEDIWHVTVGKAGVNNINGSWIPLSRFSFRVLHCACGYVESFNPPVSVCISN